VPAEPGATGHGGLGPRLARQVRHLSRQQQLAGMAGVSRQALSAVESGKSDPSLRVALAIARALELSVEEAFGPSAPAAAISAQPVARLGEAGSRVALGSVAGTFVALPLTGAAVANAGFRPAAGLVDGSGAGQSLLVPTRPVGRRGVLVCSARSGRSGSRARPL
jgi:DNA-binding XRE family transcriptional regulator